MADVVDKATRSRMMAGIRGRDTKPEITVRRIMFAAGLRYRLHRKDLPGSPDIVLSGKRVVVFVNGCFWHQHSGCRFAKLPSSNQEFWFEKLRRNVERDRESISALVDAGWRVLTIWECAVRDSNAVQTLSTRILTWLDATDQVGEIGTDT